MTKADLGFVLDRETKSVVYRFLFYQPCPSCGIPVVYLTLSDAYVNRWEPGMEFKQNKHMQNILLKPEKDPREPAAKDAGSSSMRVGNTIDSA